MSGLVIATEALPAFSGARTQSKNTAEMTSMIEAFLVHMVQWLATTARVLTLILLTCSWYLFWDDPGSYARAAGTRLSTVHEKRSTQTSNLGTPCKMYMVTVEIW